MILHKNGFIVVRVEKYTNFTYSSWPLSCITDNEIACKFTDEADDRWFTKFDMQEIAPESDYVKRYVDYCRKININAEILLAESFDNEFEIRDKYETSEVLGFDCIGTVYYSYLRTEFEFFKDDLEKKNIKLNKNGLFDTFEEASDFVELREKAISSGINLEDFWKAIPVRLSTVRLL